jgi:regulatory protein
MEYATIVPLSQGHVQATDDSDSFVETERPSFAGSETKIERRAHNVSLHALATRGQSRQEIEHRMKAREIPDDVIAAEILRLEGTGLIDDDALATDLVDRYSTRGSLGRRAVINKLRQRGLSNETIEQALGEHSVDDERAQLLEVAEARARSLRNLPQNVAQRRLVAYLNRRGFSGSSVYEVAQEVLA